MLFGSSRSTAANDKHADPAKHGMMRLSAAAVKKIVKIVRAPFCEIVAGATFRPVPPFAARIFFG
jgi:hypothetical protein